MPDALSKSAIDKATKELEQTAVAISVVGTKGWKRTELAKLAEPVLSALLGTRPGISSLRLDLRRAAHNLKVSSDKPAEAARRVRALSTALKSVQSGMKALGSIRGEAVVGDLVLFNVWGYTDKELDVLMKPLRAAGQMLDRVGLVPMSGTVVLDRQKVFFEYDKPDWKSDPLKSVGGAAIDHVLQAVAEREWTKFSSDQQDTWKRAADFGEAFVRFLGGSNVDDETKARLALSVGRNAKRWPA